LCVLYSVTVNIVVIVFYFVIKAQKITPKHTEIYMHCNMHTQAVA